MEALIKLLGMCITFIPSLYFAVYMIKRATEEQKFDFHIKRVKDKAGDVGVYIAILNRLMLFILVTCVGIYMTSSFTITWTLDAIIISLIAFIISYYIDNKNDI